MKALVAVIVALIAVVVLVVLASLVVAICGFILEGLRRLLFNHSAHKVPSIDR